MIKIYKIVNDINDKVYVGQTSLTLQERWKYHRQDAHIKRFEHRPLYVDMRQYGFEHFNIVLIEEVEDEFRYDREKFWIAKLHSFDHGYNSTYGGKGKSFISYKEIYDYWQQSNFLIKEIAQQFHCSVDSVRLALSLFGVTFDERKEKAINKSKKSVAQVTLDNSHIIQIFPSIKSTENFGFCRKHVSQVCNHTRKTHNGYNWIFVTELEQTNPDLLKVYYTQTLTS